MLKKARLNFIVLKKDETKLPKTAAALKILGQGQPHRSNDYWSGDYS